MIMLEYTGQHCLSFQKLFADVTLVSTSQSRFTSQVNTMTFYYSFWLLPCFITQLRAIGLETKCHHSTNYTSAAEYIFFLLFFKLSQVSVHIISQISYVKFDSIFSISQLEVYLLE